MEKRKMSVLTMIIIIIVALIVGAGLGYFIYERIHKQIAAVVAEREGMINIKGDSQASITIKENTETSENIQSTVTVNETDSNTTVDNVKYDGTKQISVNGKNYKISYVNKAVDSQLNSEDEQYYNVEIYFNDKKIKTYRNINGQSWENAMGAEVWKNIEEIELHSIIGEENKEYILIILNTSNASANYVKYFCVVNIEGEVIGILRWGSETGITLKDGKENTAQRTNLTYEINKDNIVIYEACRILNSQSGAVKYKVFVNDNYLYKSIEKFYNENEVELAGK